MGHIIYSGNVDELEGDRPYGDGECVALVQRLTNVGHTSRWRPGLRVVDLHYLNPGTVIANFVFENGVGRFPNKHGYHAGFFVEFGGRGVTSGKATEFVEMGQWVGRGPKRRTIRNRNGMHPAPADDAEAYWTVVVP